MASWNNNFPGWGDTGEQPPQNKNYGAEQVNEKHFDYLWDQLNKTFDEIQAHTIQDDGSVAMAADFDMGSNSINSVDSISLSGGLDMGDSNITDVASILARSSETNIGFTFGGNIDLSVDDGAGGETPALLLQAGSSEPSTIVYHDLEFGGNGSRIYLENSHLKLEDAFGETGSIITDGDETQRQIWVIANGASDPTGADPNDIILEKEP